ncbi:MAG: hypothetical protein ACREYE_15445 [Gammaproteobacteria bacterium]
MRREAARLFAQTSDNMMIAIHRPSLVLVLVSFAACSSGDDETNRSDPSVDHVWKKQTDTIEKAKEINGLIQDHAIGSFGR